MRYKMLFISTKAQELYCYENNRLCLSYVVSTAKNGLGEVLDSECTPRGWHQIHSVIGLEHQPNSVFIARQWTGEIYTPQLARQYPHRDWILTRILRLAGLEPGRNLGGDVDSFDRYIYIHGTPDSTILGIPGSHGCIRMRNSDIVQLANWVHDGTQVCIE